MFTYKKSQDSLTRFYALRLSNQSVKKLSKLQSILENLFDDSEINSINANDYHVTLLYLKKMTNQQEKVAVSFMGKLNLPSEIKIELTKIRILGRSIVLEFNSKEVNELYKNLIKLCNEKLEGFDISSNNQHEFISHITILELKKMPQDIHSDEEELNGALQEGMLPLKITLDKIDYLEHIGTKRPPEIIYHSIESQELTSKTSKEEHQRGKP